MTMIRYNTAREYLDDENITSSKQIAWNTIETEELSNGGQCYEYLEDVPEDDPRTFTFMRRSLGLNHDDVAKVMNLWQLNQKFPD